MPQSSPATRGSDPALSSGPRGRVPLLTRAAAKRLCIAAVIAVILGVIGWGWTVRMPGESFSGGAAALTPQQLELRDRLKSHIERLASGVGVRSFMQPRKLGDSVAWLMDELDAMGYEHIEQVWVPAVAGSEAGETPTPNLEVTVRGAHRPEEIIVIGAHYDSYYLTPGADDNASGVAATLELARRFVAAPQGRTLRFVFFVNEEPPHFQRETMGSLVYARRCRDRGDNIRAALVLEAIGFFSDEPGSQPYPPGLGWFYPDRGDFVAFVGNLGSRGLVHHAIASFRRHATVASEGAAAPGFIPGVDWSDHWSFWQAGYEAIMVTCTATYRNPNYHRPTDTPDTLDYDRFTRTVDALSRVIEDLANAG